MLRLCSLFVILLVCTALSTAAAGTWRARTGANLDLDFTDNVLLADEDPQSDILVSLTPRLSITHGGSRRFSSSLNYAPIIRYSIEGNRDNEIAHFLDANADAELVRNHFGVRVSAAASQRIVDRNAPFTGTSLVNPDNVTKTYSLSISPYSLPTRLGRFAYLSVDLGANLVINEEGTDSSGSNLNIALTSGPMFTRWRWGLNYTRNSTRADEDDDDDDTLGTITADATYAIDRHWNLNGSIGYDDLQANTQRNVDGLTWSAGVRWTPSPRTNFGISYGDRFGGRNYLFDLTHRHRRTTWSASLTRDITTANNEFRNLDLFPLVDADGNPILDPTLDPDATLILPGPDLDETLFILDALTVSWSWALNRTDVSLDVDYRERDNLQQDLVTNDLILRLSLARSLSPRSQASISASWIEHTEDDDSDAEYEQWSGSVSYSSSLSDSLTLSLSYQYSERDADAGDNYTENRVTLGLSSRLR